ncbi:hypothetical protein CEXT_519431 [Caerostris extrusa]|uniref:Uncharacterized protein n=1 Tax=Caerostris extrusa TaxID=172846 RepID=A0AAV4VZ62_CAEEX|nr:hypothetical protein CEXT_519431 [Caerostris extrusa]
MQVPLLPDEATSSSQRSQKKHPNTSIIRDLSHLVSLLFMLHMQISSVTKSLKTPFEALLFADLLSKVYKAYFRACCKKGSPASTPIRLVYFVPESANVSKACQPYPCKQPLTSHLSHLATLLVFMGKKRSYFIINIPSA